MSPLITILRIAISDLYLFFIRRITRSKYASLLTEEGSIDPLYRINYDFMVIGVICNYS
ncbi:MAG TPA: hypothetical protein VEW92_03530 [Nitrososphaeraceae archaeon]|nr:hypothetical protein [Nitrososphaeraceae archaeon]